MKRKKSRHHIFPKSKEGTSEPKNIAFIKLKDHENYHTLFGNMTPTEIIEWLHSYFWANQLRGKL